MSDQDFFFDDEEEKQEEAPKASKPAAPKAAARRPAAAAPMSFWNQSVTTTITALVAVIAMLVGVIVGIALPVGGSGGTVVNTGGVGTGPGVSAPALSPEELGGELPPDHPPIEQLAGEGATDTAPGTETTTTE